MGSMYVYVYVDVYVYVYALWNHLTSIPHMYNDVGAGLQDECKRLASEAGRAASKKVKHV